MFYLFSGAHTVAVIMLTLSGSARSNGALNAGYLCFQALLQAYDAAVQKKRPLVCSTSVINLLLWIIVFGMKRLNDIPYCIKLSFVSISSNQQRHACLITSLCFGQLAMQTLVIGALRSIFIFVPFFAFQAYGYLNICVHGSSEELRPWCKAKVPLLYGFIQSHYW